jgi:hypothetical protein
VTLFLGSSPQSEVEATVRKLRAALKDCEGERELLRSQVERIEQEARDGHLIVQASTEEALKTHSEVQEEMERALKEAAEREAALETSVAAHQARIASLQATVATVEARASARDDALRFEITLAERKCQEAEAARDELAANSTEATLPLLRELQAANAAAARAKDAAADTEARLLARVQTAEAALLSAETAERGARARAAVADSTVKEATAYASSLADDLAATRQRCVCSQAPCLLQSRLLLCLLVFCVSLGCFFVLPGLTSSTRNAKTRCTACSRRRRRAPAVRCVRPCAYRSLLTRAFAYALARPASWP